jgi:Uma2 family endonuclease
MATAQRKTILREVDYPTGDGKPMAETELHLWVMMDLIQTLARRFEADPMVYVGGDLLMYYEEGSPNKRLAPDVFVVKGVPKLPPRDNFLIWEEGKGPDLVIEVTSKTTRKNDQTRKLVLYRDVIRVPEYFQFDPTEDYLHPAFQGFRLRGGEYRPIKPVAGRLPSQVLGLHLERSGTELRLYDPTLGRWLATPVEESARASAESARAVAESARATAESARANLAEAEVERLRRELDELRRRLANGG